jgi:ribonuclease G
MAAVPVVAPEPTPKPEQEYEPQEAFASYRVDPVPPREFRQAGPPVLEPEAAAETPAPELEPQAQAEQRTNISATGEMHSEPPFDAAAEQHSAPAPDAVASAAPIAHRTAILDDQATETDSTGSALLPYFAPGSGLLEEEELIDEFEDEPGHIASLHGSMAADEQEDEETLEGAADLGTMIREMSIDQITRAGVADDEEEDDFDDFLEEDQDYSLEDDGPLPEGSDRESEDAAFADDEDFQIGDEGIGEVTQAEAEAAPATGARPERQGGFRRDGRRGDRNRRPGSRDRSGSSPDRSSSAEPSRERSGSERGGSDRGRRDNRDHRGGRQSMQATNLPAISDLLKPGQEILCQIAKEPIARKGARITSHIALPGRFLVFMPTVSHTGVSRKIESDAERRRLKEILLSEKGEAAGGFIVRTAAAGASEEELRSDLRFLLNLWTDIKARSESSKSPALIYHDLNLIERVLRDQVTDNFSAIWVDTESEYERVLRFLQRFQPSLVRRVKLYVKETPLFEQFGITEEINKALRSKVWLKSGGSIVINQTEALVAIDINTGKFVGKTARLEDTIVKTNLDAIPEIVRQIRLRDLGGIIIIDFIDMDERKNRNKVMAALEEELKSDRAPSKVLQFNDFGLVAITRKRVKQSLERTLSTTCGVCAGTGMVKSPVTVCNDIYIEMRKMHKHLDRGDVMLRVNPEVVKQLKSPGTKWLQEMEEMCGKTILVKSDPSLHPEQFDIH